MHQTFSLPSRQDGLQISCLATYPVEGIKPKGIVQFAHGMCEHKERYLPFMEYPIYEVPQQQRLYLRHQ